MKKNSPVIRSREDMRRYLGELALKKAGDVPSVQAWQRMRQATMFLLLAGAALQYYFLSVYLEILSLPGVVVFIPPIKVGIS
jgi:hypothetical protein